MNTIYEGGNVYLCYGGGGGGFNLLFKYTRIFILNNDNYLQFDSWNMNLIQRFPSYQDIDYRQL